MGPYYAMFPLDFAFDVVENFTPSGTGILDPFAGRGTSVFAAAATGRRGVGIEINPVGWIFGDTKLNPVSEGRVIKRLKEVVEEAETVAPISLRSLPPFYVKCFSAPVRRFLIAARDTVRWRDNRIDRTLMAFLLTYLHGKRGAALSNQMRDSKAMSPRYSVRWWEEREMSPPHIDVSRFLLQRIKWRYAKGQPRLGRGQLYLGDSTKWLARARRVRGVGRSRFGLLFTSPPYRSVTNYHYDQWLRLWLLGGAALPGPVDGEYRRRFESEANYEELLGTVFQDAARLLVKRANVYVRTDAREATHDVTRRILKDVFSSKTLKRIPRPFGRDTQTALFGDDKEKPGEVDFILT